MSVTVQEIIDLARLQHWSFTDVQMPDGASLIFLNTRQRATLLIVIKAIEGLVGETEQVVVGTNATGALVALDDNGVPYYTTTVEDGYQVRFDDANVPYVDTATPLILDPFGETGDVPGFPLPADLLRLVCVEAITSGDPTRPCRVEVAEQRFITERGGSLELRAYVSANRLIPLRVYQTDKWSTVTALRIALVRCPTLTALTDTIALPESCIETLIADVAEMFARSSRQCPEPDKRRFEAMAAAARGELSNSAENILEGITESGVIYRG